MNTNKLFLLLLVAAVIAEISQSGVAQAQFTNNQTQFVPSTQPQFTPNTQTQFVPSTKPQFTPNTQTQFTPSTPPQTVQNRTYTTGVSNQNFVQNQFAQPTFQGSNFQQFLRGSQSFSQRIDTTILSGETFTGQFLPSQGAERISAIVRSEGKATAYLDITDNTLDENNTVLGAVSVKLTPKQAQILALPAWVISIQGVRLRVVNEDSSFGNVKATITVVR
jgi:hypothetical protein